MTLNFVPWVWPLYENINTNVSTYVILFGGEIMKKGIHVSKTRDSRRERKNTCNGTESGCQKKKKKKKIYLAGKKIN